MRSRATGPQRRGRGTEQRATAERRELDRDTFLVTAVGDGRLAELQPADVADMIHAHPTLSEALMEAARTAEGRVIHV